jgi:hypothetical protein
MMVNWLFVCKVRIGQSGYTQQRPLLITVATYWSHAAGYVAVLLPLSRLPYAIHLLSCKHYVILKYVLDKMCGHV